MEVSFTNADLAAILLRPQQMRLQNAAHTALLRKGQEMAKVEGQAVQKMIQQATKLGGKLDITA